MTLASGTLGRSSVPWGLLACCLMCVLPRPASGQWGIWGVIQDLKKPAITGRVMKEYTQLLGLRPDQQNAADELLFAYEREQRRLSDRFNEVSQSINDEYEYEDDQEVQPWRDVWPRVNRTFLTTAIKLNRGIMDDLRALLDPQQAARWPEVERLNRRRTTLTWGGRPADQIDLAELIRSLRLDETTTTGIGASLTQYEADLDRELQARVKHVEVSADAWFKQMEEYDEAKWTKLATEFADVNTKVGEVNERYRRTLMTELPADAAKEFDRRVKQAIYPKIYRPSHAEMVMDVAMKLDGLDAATLEGLKGVREAYERDAAAANEKWAAAIAELDERMQKEHGQQTMWWGNWRPEDPKVQETRKARRDLDKKTTAAVRAMLTEDQRAKLPDRKWRPEWDLDSTSPAK